MSNPLITRMKDLQEKVEGIRALAESRTIVMAQMPEKMVEMEQDGYEPTAALEALQILASAIIVDEVPDDQLRMTLQEVATRFEALDDWLTLGGKTPEQWRRHED